MFKIFNMNNIFMIFEMKVEGIDFQIRVSCVSGIKVFWIEIHIFALL